MDFSDLHLAPPLLEAALRAGYETPSPIQEHAIPHLLAGKDVLGCAQTGTGKTAAFALPILHALLGRPDPKRGRAPRALVLAPTRELAAQVGTVFAAFAKGTPLRAATIFGGVGQAPQVSALRAGIDVLVATPGRLVDLANQKHIDLRRIEFFVLDEADHMLDLGFIHDVRNIIARIPEKRQTLLFSATMPKEIASLADSVLKAPVKVAVAPVSSPVESVDQTLHHVDKANKGPLLADILKDGTEAALVFSRTKHGADKIARMLCRAGIQAAAIHGNKSQSARTAALSSFKKGALRIFVATDIAARGIDVRALPLVVNYDLPDAAETYVHRIGRTGRAGLRGRAVSFCAPEEITLLRDIERLLRRSIPLAEKHALSAMPEPVVLAPRTAAGGQQRRSAQGRPAQRRLAGRLENVRPGNGGGGRPAGGNAAPQRTQNRSRRAAS